MVVWDKRETGCIFLHLKVHTAFIWSQICAVGWVGNVAAIWGLLSELPAHWTQPVWDVNELWSTRRAAPLLCWPLERSRLPNPPKTPSLPAGHSYLVCLNRDHSLCPISSSLHLRPSLDLFISEPLCPKFTHPSNGHTLPRLPRQISQWTGWVLINWGATVCSCAPVSWTYKVELIVKWIKGIQARCL